MRTLTLREWNKYRDILVKLSDKAAKEFRDAVWSDSGYFGGVGLGNIPAEDLIQYAYVLATKYGEGAATYAAEMYDEIAALSGVIVPPAIPAQTATYGETARAIQGVMQVSENEEYVANVVGRLVKQAAADTTLQNAQRDGAQFAWVTHGDTCAFCITLASNGWQPISKAALKNGHAEHIHSNCDCEYAVRFNNSGGIAGYDPDKLKREYKDANTDSKGKVTYHRDENGKLKAYKQSESTAKINAMRRANYAKNAEEINAQKREAYRLRKEVLEESSE